MIVVIVVVVVVIVVVVAVVAAVVAVVLLVVMTSVVIVITVVRSVTIHHSHSVVSHIWVNCRNDQQFGSMQFACRVGVGFE